MKNFPTRRSIFNTSAIVVHLFLLLLSIHPDNADGLVNEQAARKNKPNSCSSEISDVAGNVDVNVAVWNNVIDADHLAPMLDEESRRIGLGHRVFSRSLPTNDNDKNNEKHSGFRNAIEQTLDSILTELDDDARFVEYWTRREWRSIHAHADVDEYKAKEEQQQQQQQQRSPRGDETPPQHQRGGFRYPRNGHVLYLAVGKQVRGPTCIFPNRRTGGDLLRSTSALVATTSSDGSCDAKADGGDKDGDDRSVELVTVPAVPGRLLRFRGDYLHAVPRPTDLWLLKFVRGTPDFEPEEEFGRSVVLFNTWSDEPPSGLPIDRDDDDGSSGDPGASAAATTAATTIMTTIDPVCHKQEEWEREAPSLLPAGSSNNNDHNTADDDDATDAPRLSAKVWLLGDYRRRDFRMQTVKLEATEALREALYQETSVVSTKLTIPS